MADLILPNDDGDESVLETHDVQMQAIERNISTVALVDIDHRKSDGETTEEEEDSLDEEKPTTNKTCIECQKIDIQLLPDVGAHELPQQYCNCYRHTRCAYNYITNTQSDVCKTCNQHIKIDMDAKLVGTVKINTQVTYAKWCGRSLLPKMIIVCLGLCVVSVLSLLLSWTARLIYSSITEQTTVTVFTNGQAENLDLYAPYKYDLPIGASIFALIVGIGYVISNIYVIVIRKCSMWIGTYKAKKLGYVSGDVESNKQRLAPENTGIEQLNSDDIEKKQTKVNKTLTGRMAAFMDTFNNYTKR